jgi:hypothetical protein
VKRDQKVAAAIAVWLVVVGLSFLAWASLNGFDPTMCEAWSQCDWRHG